MVPVSLGVGVADARLSAMEEGAAGSPQPKQQTANAYWGSADRTFITLYQGLTIVSALASIAAIVEGVLLNNPGILTGGVYELVLSGGGALIAHKFRQMKDLNEVTDALKGDDDLLKHQIADQKIQLASFELENKNLKESIKKMTKENDEMIVNLKSFENELSLAKKQNEDLKSNLQNFQNDLLNAQKENDELKVSLKEFDDALNVSKKENQELENSVLISQKEIEQLKSLIKDLEQDKKELEETKTEITFTAKDIRSSTKALQLAEKQFETLKSEFSLLEDKEKKQNEDMEKLIAEHEKKAIEYAEKEEELIKKEEAQISELNELLQFKKMIDIIEKIAPETLATAKAQLNH